ncbi:DUF1636 family protein [Roseobacter sp. EG26]|uniref:DUF1636 family protein n=1 Tax=Roseobacter sp. EG26 TaxID=3412477 RepID=UPI003CE5586A
MGTSRHRITICTSCPHKGRSCAPGYELIARLRAAIDVAGDTITDDFEISGVAFVAGCGRPCTLAYHGTRTAAYLFGDVDAEADIGTLVTLARQNTHIEGEWLSQAEGVDKLRRPRPRTPAAIIALEESDVRIS